MENELVNKMLKKETAASFFSDTLQSKLLTRGAKMSGK
jgi:hypothetical protein